MTAAEKFQRLLKVHSQYDAEAYNFVFEALDYTLKNVVNTGRRANQHVAGPELLEGIRRLSINQFGCLSRSVFESWGVKRTDDFGKIVFNLVEFDLMGKQESDRPTDFENVYDFETVFEVTPYFHYSRERDEWKASYIPSSQRTRKRSRIKY